MKVIFIKSAAGIGLAYAVGSEAEFADAYANELIERGYCRPIEEVKQAVAHKPEEVKQAVSKKKAK